MSLVMSLPTRRILFVFPDLPIFKFGTDALSHRQDSLADTFSQTDVKCIISGRRKLDLRLFCRCLTKSYCISLLLRYAISIPELQSMMVFCRSIQLFRHQMNYGDLSTLKGDGIITRDLL